MLEFCTCGAQLVPDSLFCHKCGKPQREIVTPNAEPAEETAVEEPPAPVVAATLDNPELPRTGLDFHNLAALRIGLMVAPVAFLLSWIPAVNLLLWLGAGFLAVLLHRRRTGVLLNVRAGVRLGWITGVIMFAVTTVIFTLTVAPAAATGKLAMLFRQQVKNQSDPNVQEVLRSLETAPGLASVLIIMLCLLFVFITLASVAGGALGAKYVGRNSQAR